MKSLNKLMFLSVVVLIFLFFVSMSIANNNYSEQETITEAELQKVYDSLPEQDKKLIDTWSSDERARYLKAKVFYNRAIADIPVKSIQKQDSQEPPEKYELDPSLKKAYLAYQDANCPREKIIDLFNSYIEKNPKSVFLPEIYFRIGALYSIHRREKLGEKKDWKLQKEYYQKAHEIYGERFSYLNNTAWASLANHSYSTLEFRKKYYDWLLRLKKSKDPNDVYPIREVGQTLNGRSPYLSQEEILLIASSNKQNLLAFIDTAEKNIMWRTASNYQELVDLATSYPDTNLGKQAEIRLKGLDKFLLEGLELNDESVTDLASKGVVAAKTLVKNTNATIDDASTVIDRDSNEDIERTPSQEIPPVASSGRWKVTVAIGLVGFCVAVAFLVWANYRRRQPAETYEGSYQG